MKSKKLSYDICKTNFISSLGQIMRQFLAFAPEAIDCSNLSWSLWSLPIAHCLRRIISELMLAWHEWSPLPGPLLYCINRDMCSQAWHSCSSSKGMVSIKIMKFVLLDFICGNVVLFLHRFLTLNHPPYSISLYHLWLLENRYRVASIGQKYSTNIPKQFWLFLNNILWKNYNNKGTS